MLQVETTRQNQVGQNVGTDLLSSIYKIQIRNEEKISDADRVFCENQQQSLYKTLDEIDRWYSIFKEEALKYKESHRVSFEVNGKVNKHDSYHNRYGYERTDYTDFEFKPFDNIDKLVEKNCNAVTAFARTIVSYFNKTYNVSVPAPDIDDKTLQMGFRPVYQSYVDQVIEHLGGKSFRDTAEDELINRFLNVVKLHRWSKVKPELKKDKIVFPDVLENPV